MGGGKKPGGENRIFETTKVVVWRHRRLGLQVGLRDALTAKLDPRSVGELRPSFLAPLGRQPYRFAKLSFS